jgi:hypothetical protein
MLEGGLDELQPFEPAERIGRRQMAMAALGHRLQRAGVGIGDADQHLSGERQGMGTSAR